MSQDVRRRDVLALASFGGVVFASGLVGCGGAPGAGAPPQVASSDPNARVAAPPTALAAPKVEDFFFLQLTDTHWGYKGPANPEAETCLKKTVAAINASPAQPDFIVHTGDLTHLIDDPKERRARLGQVKEILAGLTVKKVYAIPGEHDASLDKGEAFKEIFGPPYHAFAHKGVYFIALDNGSSSALGDAQLDWMKAEVAKVPDGAPLVVLAHKPLFDLFPEWEWATKDADKALALLGNRDATVFYGHIHQENHKVTGKVSHHSARSLIFPLPAPGSVPKKAPLAWDPASKDHGIGHRAVMIEKARARVEEKPFG